jgi:hypothetical protein
MLNYHFYQNTLHVPAADVRYHNNASTTYFTNPNNISNNALKAKVEALEHEVVFLRNQLVEIDRKLDTMWYAPYAPGAESAQASFEKLNKQRCSSMPNLSQ